MSGGRRKGQCPQWMTPPWGVPASGLGWSRHIPSATHNHLLSLPPTLPCLPSLPLILSPPVGQLRPHLCRSEFMTEIYITLSCTYKCIQERRHTTSTGNEEVIFSTSCRLHCDSRTGFQQAVKHHQEKSVYPAPMLQ